MMTRIQTAALLGLLVLAAVACSPSGPTDPEPRASVPEPAGSAAPVASVTESPSPSPPEPLALRFVSPNLGPANGGNDVTIDGRGFHEYPRIEFGGVAAWIRSVTPTEIRVTVPAPAEPITGTLVVDVTVTNPPEGSEAPVSQTLTRSYSYLEPTSGESSSGQPNSDEPESAPATPDEPVTEPTAAAQVSVPPTTAPTPPTNSTAASPRPTEPATEPPTLVASFGFAILPESDDCPGTRVRFTDRSTGGPTEWWWDFGDGDNSDQQHHVHCYTAPGMRSVSLTVSNSEESALTSKIVTAGME